MIEKSSPAPPYSPPYIPGPVRAGLDLTEDQTAWLNADGSITISTLLEDLKSMKLANGEPYG